MYDASSRKDIRSAEKAAERLANDRIAFLRASLDTREGRAWFYHLLGDCHLFSDPFTGDALREAYLKGERNVGLRIFAEISEHCPDQYITMVKEENVRRHLASARQQSRRPNPDGRDHGRFLDPFTDAGDDEPGDDIDGTERYA